MKYKKGDILIDKRRNKVKILGVCGLVYFISAENDFKTADSYIYTEEDLNDGLWELFTEPKETILTMDEVAKLAGVSVDKLKIVKE